MSVNAQVYVGGDLKRALKKPKQKAGDAVALYRRRIEDGGMSTGEKARAKRQRAAARRARTDKKRRDRVAR
jgi:hypothetical protein